MNKLLVRYTRLYYKPRKAYNTVFLSLYLNLCLEISAKAAVSSNAIYYSIYFICEVKILYLMNAETDTIQNSIFPRIQHFTQM